MFRTHKDIVCHKHVVNSRKQWEVPTGHKEDRRDTTMNSRPRRQRTRQGVDKQWKREYDLV